MEGEKVPLPMI